MSDYLLDRTTAAVGGHYRIEEEIGRGGMAVVYRATDLRLNRPVAIKVLPPDVAFNADVKARFIREAQTAAQLTHPNIVAIYTVDEDPSANLVYFVMAFVDGESLGVRLAREGAWPVDATTRVLHDVADALAYAHARGVVHRDIKPDNILIDRATGRPMVTDFGIARAEMGETRLTVTGVAVGTPAYMSPEQALGEREIDGRSDVYSLAVVGYHMLTGETPFVAANTPAMLVKHVSERPRPIRDRRPDIPAHLAVVIDRALAKRPDDRFANAEEFRDAVTAGSPMHGANAVSAANVSRASFVSTSSNADRLDAESTSTADPRGRPFPMPPSHLHGRELREWLRAQRRIAVSQQLQHGGVSVAINDAALWTQFQRFEDRPLEERVTAFRRSVGVWATWTALFLGANLMMHGPGPWFLIPSGFMFLKTLRRGSSIWSDGIGPIDAFTKGINKRIRAEDRRSEAIGAPDARGKGAVSSPSETPDQAAARLAPPDVLAGRFGDAVRRAAGDRLLMRDIVASLGPIEREMIPDVTPTLDALTERVGSLATTLHRLDADVSGASLGALDARIASLQTEPDNPDRERRLTLLQRQRSSLRDLLDRRQALAGQMESAGLMLQNLKLDLLKLRSSGLGTAVHDQVSATQEARALSREIGHVVDAAEDLRKL